MCSATPRHGVVYMPSEPGIFGPTVRWSSRLRLSVLRDFNFRTTWVRIPVGPSSCCFLACVNALVLELHLDELNAQLCC